MKIMMFINFITSFLALTCLSSKPLYDHKQVSGIERKNAVGDVNQVSYSFNENVYQINGSTNSGNLAYHNYVAQSSRFSYTFVFENRVQTILDNEFDDNDLENLITSNNFTSYYYGFYDKAGWYYVNETYRFYLQRYYFVNPVQFGLGTYYIDDHTWYYLYQNSNDNEYYGGWQGLIDYISPSGLYMDDFDTYLYLASDGGHFTLYRSNTLDSVEPQRHYGNTFSFIGGDTGQNLNTQHYTFLPYWYCFCDFEYTSAGSFSDLTSSVYIEFYKTSYLDNYNDGYNAGYNAGNSDGLSTGYDEGYDDGYEEGWGTGYGDGYEEGFREGDAFGYVNGFNDADNMDETALVIFTGIIDIGLLPINFFLAMLNFEVFGINIGGLVSAFMTIAIVVIIARVVMGGKKDD